jgi:hypothetical protein
MEIIKTIMVNEATNFDVYPMATLRRRHTIFHVGMVATKRIWTRFLNELLR